MRYVGNQPTFGFHPRCEQLAITHLCFADDLMLFCKGDANSVCLLMRGLEAFTLTSGLAANRNKSAVYFGNVKEQVHTRIIEMSGFSEGKFPFRYLGVPISLKRISASDCEILVDKICSRIKCWGSCNLSYATQVQIINSVLMSLYTYWETIFVIPQSILNAILSVCCNYLWEGKEHATKSPPIAWEIVCRDKTHGGLNVRDGKLWNIAAVGKYIWQVSMKLDNLWVKWIHGSIFIIIISGYMFPPMMQVGFGRNCVNFDTNLPLVMSMDNGALVCWEGIL